jgi:O-antigen ligase
MTLKEKIFLSLCILLASSLFWSNFLISQSVIWLFLTSLYDWDKKTIRRSWKEFFIQFFRHPTYSSLTCVFLLSVISGVLSEDMVKGFQVMQLRLPYLLLPVAFFLYRPISEKVWFYFIQIFILLAVAFSVGVFIHYRINFEQLQQGISMGQSIPAPVSHIRFSMLLVIAVGLGIIYLIKQGKEMKPFKRSLAYVSILWLILIIHILSVKTGWVTLYLSLGLIMLWMVLNKINIRLVYMGLLLMIVIPVLSFLFIPSFSAKVGYMLYDWRQWEEGDGGVYSDLERWKSIEYGWEVFMDNPLTGTGTGDLKTAMSLKYKTYRGEDDYVLMPHNQFIYYLASMGIIGTIFLFPAMIIPFFRKGKQDIYLLLIGLVVISSCLVESTFETSVGMHIHLLFLLVRLNILAGSQKT